MIDRVFVVERFINNNNNNMRSAPTQTHDNVIRSATNGLCSIHAEAVVIIIFSALDAGE